MIDKPKLPATHCNNTATCCNTLHRVPYICMRTDTIDRVPVRHCNALQRAATDCIGCLVCICNALQHVALQHTAPHCKPLQHAATHCNICLISSSEPLRFDRLPQVLCPNALCVTVCVAVSVHCVAACVAACVAVRA